LNKFVTGMAMFRLVSGSLEIMAALLMIRWNQVDKALLINSGLALVGPFVLLSTTAIGLAGMADKLSWGKLIWVMAGVGCVFVGILKK
jgi:hypothetical protein